LILTYKVRHDRDFSEELRKAKQVADHAVRYRTFTSKDVKHIGLKSMIANQILRKYGRNKTIKKARNVNLIVPSQGNKADQENRIIIVACLKLVLSYQFPQFEKVNQIEVDEEYAYVSVPEKEIVEPKHYVGVDLNATGHAAVVGDPKSGRVWKLGKQCQHVHKKYKNIRRRLQRLGKYGMVKKIKDRESRIVRDINHKISRKIVQIAETSGSGIKLEDLKGQRQPPKMWTNLDMKLQEYISLSEVFNR
jgi:putative transposase